ncbi:MAG: hypothetical protein ACRDWY_09715 [Actinomycetes bacterium]
MTALALILLVLAAVAPVALILFGRVVDDPVVPTAALTAALLLAAAATAAGVDPVDGWRLAAALVLGVAVATTGGGLAVRSVFRLMRREFLPARTTRVSVPPVAATGDDAGTPGTETEPGTVLRGGAWIGYLERAAVAATVLAGWPEGVALVLAVKGVGRYAELRETNAPEAFIIGTLTSLLWAVAAAGTAHLLR